MQLEKIIKELKEERLKNDQLNLFEKIVKSFPLGIQIFDKEGNTEFLNPKQRFLLGLNVEDDKVLPFNVLKDTFSHKTGAAKIYQKVYSEKVQQIRYFSYDFGISENTWETRKDKRYFQEVIFPVFNKNNEVDKVITILNDFSEQKANEIKISESEAQFRSIYENAVAGIAFTNAKGVIEMVNSHFANMLGYSVGELIGVPFGKITHTEDINKEKQMIKNAIDSGKDNYRFEKRYIKKDQSPVWVDISVSIIRDTDKSPKYFVGIVIDIDENKKLNLELISALDKINMITNTSPVAIVMVNNDGVIDFANAKAERMLKLKISEGDTRTYDAPEWNITDFDGKPFPIERLPFIRVQRERDTIYDVRHAISFSMGEVIYLSINASPRFDNEGNFLGMIATMENITRQVEDEKKLLETNRKLSEINAAKDKFFSIIAHDLKNPFGSILNLTDLLIEKIENKEFQDALNISRLLNSSANKGFNLLVNLLDWSRSQTGKITFKPVKFELNVLISEVIDVLKYSAENKGVTINFSPDISEIVLADKNMISTIIRNLLSNSIKYTGSGGIVEININHDENETTVSVSDTGIGIKEENLKKIFKIDIDFSTPGTKQESGTGLGLIICKEFIERHGGKIWAENLKKGTKFAFTIPLTTNPVFEKNKDSNEKNMLKNSKKVLVAEDEEINFIYMSELFKSTTFEIIRAENGKEAVDKCKENPDLSFILMDIRMPVMDGIEATREIRKINSTLPIIAQTAYDLTAETKALFDEYIAKPIRKQQINKLIDDYGN